MQSNFELEIKKNKISVFKIVGDLEYIAGAAAGATYIVRKLNETNVEDTELYTISINTNISEFRVINSVHRSFVQPCLNDDGACNYFGTFFNKNKNYGIWIESAPSRGATYSLYNFSSAEFLDGVNAICEFFKIDYTSIVFDSPFNKSGEYVDTDYYFQSGLIYSIFIDDAEVDIDEAGDENIQDPYSNYDDFDNIGLYDGNGHY